MQDQNGQRNMRSGNQDPKAQTDQQAAKLQSKKHRVPNKNRQQEES